MKVDQMDEQHSKHFGSGDDTIGNPHGAQMFDSSFSSLLSS